MNGNKILLFIIFTGTIQHSIIVSSQNNGSAESDELSDLFEELASSEIESSDAEEISEDLSFYLENPLDLNKAGEEDLKKLHLLNDFQIYTLLGYIRDYGPILSVMELPAITGFSTDIARKLEPYIEFVPAQTIPVVHSPDVNQELVLKFACDLEKFKYAPDSAGQGISYMGKNRSISSRYQIRSGKVWRAGLTMDQDAGESFHPPDGPFQPDFVSAFAEINGKGLLNHLIIGDFRASYGQGLILSGHTQRKGITVLKKPDRSGIRKYSSAGENDFFRGAAMKLKYNNLSMDLFFSNFHADATIHRDSCNYFKSLITTGFHRTESELQKKDAVLIGSFGTHIGYKKEHLDIGFTYFSQNFNIDYLIAADPFLSVRLKKHDHIRNVSSDYKFNMKNIILFGEIAADYQGRPAILNGMILKLHPLISYSFIHRKYHRSYLGLKSCGFGEKTHTRNEEGYYTGLEIYLWKYFKIDIFSDHYRFPFPDFTSSSPIYGSEYFLNCSFYPGSEIEFIYRFRYEKKQESENIRRSRMDLTMANRKTSNRFELKFNIPGGLVLKSRTELSHLKKNDSGWTMGFYCGNDISYENKDKSIRLWMRYAIFDIPEWDNRIYAYENDIPFTFSIPAYHKSGARTIFLAKISPCKNAEFWFRYSLTVYNRTDKSGSSGDQSKISRNPFLSIQLRLKI